MTPAEIALIAQLLSLATEAIAAAITARQNLGDNANATEQANLDSAHANFQTIIASANKILNPTIGA